MSATLDGALEAHHAGRLAEAESLYHAALAAGDPALDVAPGLTALFLQQGRPSEAVTWLETLCAAHPDAPVAHAALGTALQAAGRAADAVDAYEDALALAPDHAESQYGLGAALHILGRLDEAAACYRRALAIDPDYAEAEYGLGLVCQSFGHLDDAIAAQQRALDVDPDYAEARLGLAAALHAAGRMKAAEAEYRTLVQAPEPEPAAIDGLSGLLLANGDHAAALNLLDAALLRDALQGAERVMLHRRRGQVLAELGKLDEAAAALARALAIQPSATLYRELANVRRLQPGDPHVAAMHALAAQAETLPVKDQIQLQFALGRVLTDAGDAPGGFVHLLAGNSLQRDRIHYDEAATLRLLADIADAFTPELLRRLDGAGDASAAPIFIVGMPRSGSTLIEQVLRSHADVVGGGERTDFGRAVRAVGLDTEDLPYPSAVPDLDRETLRRLGADYLARAGVPTGRRATDKMLANAMFAGLLHLALPAAKIVYARRDPVDTCLSCFAELFANDVPFAYDLGELGRFHRGHTALMDHWRRVLPSHVMIDIDYEDMVRDLPRESRRLLEHCGLEWSPAVLEFHANGHPVRTASFAQVRRPLYSSSVGRWRPDHAILRPLLDGLGIAG